MFKISFRIAILLSAAVLVAGCTPDVPKCSDESTLDLVRGILNDHLKLQADAAELRMLFTFEYPRAVAFDDKIGKYSCTAKVIGGGTYQLPISYESQLDDGKRHLVSMGQIMAGDTILLGAEVRKKMHPPAVSTVTPATETKVEALAEPGPVPIVGRWHDEVDGQIEMQVTDVNTGYHIVLSVLAPECFGEIDGHARLEGDTLAFTKAFDGGTCKITATFRHGIASVNEDNCLAFHGAACGYAGILNKID